MLNTELDSRTNIESPAVKFIWMELTRRCNLSCSHCYTASSPYTKDVNPLSLDEQLTVLAEGYELGCRSIQFIGGEPTLDRNLSLLVSRAHEIGYGFVEIYTNLTRLSPELLHCIVENKAHVATSVYSNLASTHDSVTNVRGSFKRTIANLKTLVANDVPVRVSIIEMDENAGGLPQTVAFLRDDIGVSDIKMDRARPFGRAGESSAKSADIGDLCGSCANGTLCIGPDGMVTPCIMSKSFEIGSVRTDALRNIALSDHLESVRGAIRDAVQARSAAERCAPTCAPDVCTPKGGCPPIVIDKLRSAPEVDSCGPDECGPIIGCPPYNECAPKMINAQADPCGPDVGCRPLNECGPVINSVYGCGPDECGPVIACPPYNKSTIDGFLSESRER